MVCLPARVTHPDSPPSQLMPATWSGQSSCAAARSGKEVYVDVNGWHLYLRDISVPGADAKLSQALAQHLGSKVCACTLLGLQRMPGSRQA